MDETQSFAIEYISQSWHVHSDAKQFQPSFSVILLLYSMLVDHFFAATDVRGGRPDMIHNVIGQLPA